MSKYDKVKEYYTSGLWSISRVANAVKKGWISESQFTEITSTSYPPNRL